MVALFSAARVSVVALLLTGCAAKISMKMNRLLPRLIRSRVTHAGVVEIQPQGIAQHPESAEHNGDGGLEGSATTKAMSSPALVVINGDGQVGDVDAQSDVVTQRETTTTDPQVCKIRAISTTWGVKDVYFRVEAECITKVFGAIPDKTKVVHCVGEHNPICKPIKIRMWPNPGKTYDYKPNDGLPPCYHGRAEFATSTPQHWQVGDTIETSPQTCRIRAISTKWIVKGTYFRVESQCITRVFGAKKLYKTEVTHCIQGQTPCKTIEIKMWPNSGSPRFFPNDAGLSDYHGRSQFGSQAWQIGDTISPVPREQPKAQLPAPQTIHRGRMTGKMDNLWLFGSPVPSRYPLMNELSADGCFPGKRVYATTWSGKIDNAAVISPVLMSKTNVMDLIVLRVDAEHQFPNTTPANWGSAEAKLIKCYGTEDIKPSCLSNPTAARKVARAPFGRLSTGPVQAHMHTDCYFFNYSDPLLLKMYGIARSYKTGMNCVMNYDGIREVSRVKVRDPFYDQDLDMAYLHQNVSSLKCFIVFRPLDKEEQLLEKLQQPVQVSWCGMRRVSKYIAGELDGLIKSSQWKTKIQDKLPKCNGVELPAHSLAGAMASLLAACLNRKAWDPQTYDALLWTFDKPQLLTPEPDANPCNGSADIAPTLDN